MNRLILLIFLVATKVSVAQLSENFSDGNFTANPTWSGDVASFIVSGDSLRSNSTTVNDTLYLSTSSTQSAQVQWDFLVRLALAPSSTNYVDIYLMSDVANLTQTQNGYFVRIGNTAKEISLYSIVGGVKTLIIDGANNSVTSSNNKIKIKVTRNAANLWTLKREVNGTGNNFFTEQTVVDANVTTTAFFGFFVRQSVASNFKKHWLDDINIGNIVIDNVPPTLLNVKVINSNNLDVYFNEPVDVATVQNVANYFVSNSIAAPTNAMIDVNDASIVHLTFANNFSTGIDYTITINNVADIALNTIAANTTSVFYIATMFDVVINEIMADPTPTVGLPDAEYIELYNKSSHTINMQDWKLVVGTSTKILPAYTLLPNSYVLLVNPTSAPLYSTLTNVISLTGLSTSSLTNSGTTLQLKNNVNELIHQISYTDQWYLDALKANGGWSLEQIDPNNPCAANLNWRASVNTNGGTPGVVNSINGVNIDNNNPYILAATVVNDSTIQLQFSETVIALNLNNLSAYNVSNGIGNPNAVAVSGVLSNVVTLTFSTPFIANIIYTVSVTGVLTDCAGNAQTGVSQTTFSKYTPQIFDLVFNEIMADPDPSQGIPNVEYVELFNRTNFPINLKNWKFKYGSTEKEIVSGTIAANGYALITSPTNAIALSSLGNYNVLNTPDLANSFLTNSGTSLLLQDSVGHYICFTNYADTWYGNSTKALGGWSLEKIDPSNLCAEKTNWKAAIVEIGGTPGAINSVNAGNPDNVAPSTKNICVLDSNSIQIDFSELIATNNLANASITINNNITVQQVFVGNEYSNSIIIKSTQNFAQNIVYTASINISITDCNGNAHTATSTANFSTNVADLYQVVINEIMVDPSPVISTLPELEYVEIYNKSTFPISLKDYSFAIGTTINTIGCNTINPNEYALICRSNDENSLQVYAKTIGISSLSLTNTGEVLQLLNEESEIVSIVNYSDAWYGSTYKATGGWSLEQIDPNNPCGGKDNWKASSAEVGGTPGAVNAIYAVNADVKKPELIRALVVDNNTLRLFFNETLSGTSILENTIYNVDNNVGNPQSASIAGINASDIILTFAISFIPKTIYNITVKNTVTDCVGNLLQASSTADFAIAENPVAGDILINEILYNPQTDGYDFVEIYNNSDKVIDLRTLRISNIDSTNLSLSSIYQIDTIGYLIFPKKYYVITESSEDILKRYNVPNKKNFILIDNLPTLSITGGSVAISKANLDLIDYTFYNDNMQFPLLVSSKGVSLERISFTRKSTDVGNWHSAAETVGFATPTFQNSQYNPESYSDDVLTLSNEIFSPDNDGYEDALQIAFNASTVGNVASISIYNQRGVFIKQLANNVLLGTNNNVLTWDGTNAKTQNVEIGIYIIVATFFDAKGDTKKIKKSVVVAAKL